MNMYKNEYVLCIKCKYVLLELSFIIICIFILIIYVYMHYVYIYMFIILYVIYLYTLYIVESSKVWKKPNCNS